MKWLILAIFAEVSVLLCLIYTFDGALHSWSSARLTWDHAAVVLIYTYVRAEFSRKRMGKPTWVRLPIR
jgi:fructose-1,6-bisphosphatase/inositol monophosphatase family enzyme